MCSSDIGNDKQIRAPPTCWTFAQCLKEPTQRIGNSAGLGRMVAFSTQSGKAGSRIEEFNSLFGR